MRQGERTDHTVIAVRSQDEAARLLNVSVDTLRRAKVVQKHGADEPIHAVDAGKVGMDGKALQTLAGTASDGSHSFVVRLIHEGKPKGTK
jgi:hypothetical protein